MVITEKIELVINNRYVKYYKELGYDVKGGDKIEILVEHLPESSHVKVLVKCDNCDEEKELKYYNYMSSVKNQGYYVCKKCKHTKMEKSNILKYGVKTTLLENETKKKIKATIKEKYGVEHYSQSSEFKDSMIKSNNEKYGVDWYFLCDNIKEKRFEKFGHEYYSQTEEFKHKTKSTMLDRYGVEHYSKTKEFKSQIDNKSKIRYKEKYNINILSCDGEYYNILCDKGHEYKIHKYLLKNRLYKYNTEPCTICNCINSHTESGKEIRFGEYIKSIYDGEILYNDRRYGKELDIYLPEFNLAFEFNGLYWHNELYKEKNYHKTKTELCEENGIQLIHVWEDEWDYKTDIVKSLISNKLNLNKENIYGRKTKIEVMNDNKIVKKFLNENHIQGEVNSSIKLGLYYDGELVSLMTFGKKRKVMNSSSKEGEYELLRFCNKLNTSVIGGASKLFKYFTINYDFTEITTYADRSHSNGNLYKTLGFDFVSKTQPNYHYVIEGNRFHRFGFRKDVLVKEGFDPNKTEHEIMLERKIYRIYNSGNLKYIYKK